MSSSSENSSSEGSEGSSSSDSLESGAGKGREILQNQRNLSNDSSSDSSDDDRYVPPENGVAAFFAEGATPRPISVDPPDNEKLVPVYDANVISSSAIFSFKPDFTSKRARPQLSKPLKNTPIRPTSDNSGEIQSRGSIGAKRERDSTSSRATEKVSELNENTASARCDRNNDSSSSSNSEEDGLNSEAGEGPAMKKEPQVRDRTEVFVGKTKVLKNEAHLLSGSSSDSSGSDSSISDDEDGRSRENSITSKMLEKKRKDSSGSDNSSSDSEDGEENGRSRKKRKLRPPGESEKRFRLQASEKQCKEASGSDSEAGEGPAMKKEPQVRDRTEVFVGKTKVLKNEAHLLSGSSSDSSGSDSSISDDEDGRSRENSITSKMLEKKRKDSSGSDNSSSDSESSGSKSRTSVGEENGRSRKKRKLRPPGESEKRFRLQASEKQCKDASGRDSSISEREEDGRSRKKSKPQSSADSGHSSRLKVIEKKYREVQVSKRNNVSPTPNMCKLKSQAQIIQNTLRKKCKACQRFKKRCPLQDKSLIERFPVSSADDHMPFMIKESEIIATLKKWRGRCRKCKEKKRGFTMCRFILGDEDPTAEKKENRKTIEFCRWGTFKPTKCRRVKSKKR